MTDIDLFKTLHCKDCKKQFYVSGSAALVVISCTHCGSKNWQYEPFANTTKK
jgi:hypothetical protein